MLRRINIHKNQQKETEKCFLQLKFYTLPTLSTFYFYMWVKVERVEVKDIRLPQSMQRAMAAEAEAQRWLRQRGHGQFITWTIHHPRQFITRDNSSPATIHHLRQFITWTIHHLRQFITCDNSSPIKKKGQFS
ncbi:hypothetical protein DdX_05840 [Ditylenchus destructor]|uniref:Uncharacterized protein n=1 Tax=Ditylenchus destructor TaxID=166010 RepID=A0AAD4RA67_9BILA|nr:hypothetical protein DdX_05840 [Ditylenchus destructor]